MAARVGLTPSPTTQGEFFTNHIEEHGEGVQSTAFKVDDLDAATRHAVDGGLTVLRRFQTAGTDPYAHRYSEFT